MPSTSSTRPVDGRVTGRLVEKVLGRSLAVFCVVYGAEAIPFLRGQAVLPDEWRIPLVVALYGSFLAIVVLGFLGRDFRVLAQFVTAAFLIVLVAWPVMALEPDLVADRSPWFWALSDLAVTASVFAYSAWVSAVYSTVVSILYFVVRQTPPGGSGSVLDATAESVHAILFGAIALILVLVLRKAARRVDSAQIAAVERYSQAVREHAIEIERVEVDAIVHDGVLTALIVAAKAEVPPARRQATGLAQVAMDRIEAAAESGPGSAHTVSLRTLCDRLRHELDRLDPAAGITPVHEVPAMVLPGDVAETLFSAASQAIVNSCQHAGDGARRRVRVRLVESVAEIAVIDDGRGYDTSVPSERLGVRVSILERVRNAGGVASIRSRIGDGTTVTLRWTNRSEELAGLRA